MKTLREVSDVTHRVREQFETRSYNRVLIGGLYMQHNSVAIEQFLDDAERFFPRINCGLVSLAIQYALGEGDIVNGSYGPEPHTFLAVDTIGRRDVIVDATADQFGGPDVYVGKLIVPWSWPDSIVITG